VTELADILRVVGPAYVQRFGDRLLPSHRRAIRDIVMCRTAALGGQMFLCEYCGLEHPVYHSCRNRHCPKCQKAEAELWLARQRDLLLPCEYGLATCTLPAGLREIARSHQRVVYSILMREAAHALMELAADRRFIGGLIGIMSVLHTWTRMMGSHPHVHMLFPIGGLVDGDTWIKPRKRTYILPAYGLARRFRERVEIAFRKAGLYDLVPRSVWCKPWVANVKRVGSGDAALLYLSRYVFRIAISNDRIDSFDGERVTFSGRNRKGGYDRLTLDAGEFIRRFLQHVLPRHFVKVRYYGLWASTCRDKLATAQKILEHHLEAIGIPPRTLKVRKAEASTQWRPRCPACGCVFRHPPRELPRPRGPP
jgi:hypothetical protein